MEPIREHATLLLVTLSIAGWVLLVVTNWWPLVIVGLVALVGSFGILFLRMYRRQQLLHRYVDQSDRTESSVEQTKRIHAFQDMFRGRHR